MQTHVFMIKKCYYFVNHYDEITCPSSKNSIYILTTLTSFTSDEVPSERQLLGLASDLGVEWEELAIHLGLHRAHVEQCKMDHPHSALSRIAAMLMRWRGRCSERRCSRRVDMLIEALLSARRTDLAERVAQWKLVGKDLNLDWDTTDKTAPC